MPKAAFSWVMGTARLNFLFLFKLSLIFNNSNKKPILPSFIYLAKIRLFVERCIVSLIVIQNVEGQGIGRRQWSSFYTGKGQWEVEGSDATILIWLDQCQNSCAFTMPFWHAQILAVPENHWTRNLWYF